MKKNYMVYEKDYGTTGIIFDSLKEVNNYVKLMNDANVEQYYYKEYNSYNSVKDFFDNNQEQYINFLNNYKDKIENNYCKVKLTEGLINLYYRHMKTIVEKKKLDFCGWSYENKSYEVKCGDFEIIQNEYIRLTNKLNTITNKINAYKNKDYKEINTEF